jgi:hypothetical protein
MELFFSILGHVSKELFFRSNYPALEFGRVNNSFDGFIGIRIDEM